MLVKSQLNIGCSQLSVAYRILNQHKTWVAGCNSLCYWTRNLLTTVHSYGRRTTSGKLDKPYASKWKLVVNIERPVDVERHWEISLPMLVYLYSPWVTLTTKYNLFMLKLLWDWKFNEKHFVENAKQALVLVTKFIVRKQKHYIKRCSTPLGYKQITNNIIDSIYDHSKLMFFEERHISRCFPLKVQRIEHYGRKFAFIDMLFLVTRRTNDFVSRKEIEKMIDILDQYGHDKIIVPNPIIFTEIFIRFRRDYSMQPTVRNGHWLISNYKVLKFDVLNYYPDIHAGSELIDLAAPNNPLRHGA